MSGRLRAASGRLRTAPVGVRTAPDGSGRLRTAFSRTHLLSFSPFWVARTVLYLLSFKRLNITVLHENKRCHLDVVTFHLFVKILRHSSETFSLSVPASFVGFASEASHGRFASCEIRQAKSIITDQFMTPTQ